MLPDLPDPILHSTKEGIKIGSILTQFRLDDVSIKYYDVITGDIISYERLIYQYGIGCAISRFTCEFNVPIEFDADLLKYCIRSINLWFDLKIAHIELTHYDNIDYSAFIPYMKISKPNRYPDRILSY